MSNFKIRELWPFLTPLPTPMKAACSSFATVTELCNHLLPRKAGTNQSANTWPPLDFGPKGLRRTPLTLFAGRHWREKARGAAGHPHAQAGGFGFRTTSAAIRTYWEAHRSGSTHCPGI